MSDTDRAAKKSRLLLYGLYVLTFLLGCYITANAPLATDDYMFLAKHAVTFRQALRESLHYGNGRLLGNLINLLLLRRPALLAAEKGAFLLGVPALAAKLAAGKDRVKEPLFFVSAALMLFGMNASIFAEVISWTSGFQNYVPSVFCMLVCSAAFVREPKNKAGGAIDMALIVLFGVTGQLYMELHSLMNGLIVGALAVFCFLRQREKLAKSLVWLASLAAGGVIMFAVPIVFPPFTASVSNYRKLHIHSLGELLRSVSTNATIAVNGLIACRVLVVLLGAAALLLAQKHAASFRRPLVLTLCRTGLAISMAFSVLFGFLGAKTMLTKYYSLYSLAALAAFAVFSVSVAVILLHLPNTAEKALLLGGAAAAAAAMAPMMIVEPFGPRCLFLSYCLLGGCVLTAARLLVREAAPAALRATLWTELGAFAALAVCLGLVFTDVGWMSRMQVSYIQYKLKERPQQIEVITLPTDYVYTPEIWGFGRVYYNDEPLDVEYVFLDYADWYANRQAEGWL